jgi:hypothetical protein
MISVFSALAQRTQRCFFIDVSGIAEGHGGAAENTE